MTFGRPVPQEMAKGALPQSATNGSRKTMSQMNYGATFQPYLFNSSTSITMPVISDASDTERSAK